MANDNGDKDQGFQGVRVNLSDLMRRDGLTAEALDKSTGQTSGVVQTLITAEEDNKHYRQILKRARWKNQEQRNKFVKAIAVCRLTNAKKALDLLLDQITADSAGDEGALMHEAGNMLTHTTLTTRQELSKKGKGYDNYGNKSNSPIARQ